MIKIILCIMALILPLNCHEVINISNNMPIVSKIEIQGNVESENIFSTARDMYYENFTTFAFRKNVFNDFIYTFNGVFAIGEYRAQSYPDQTNIECLTIKFNTYLVTPVTKPYRTIKYEILTSCINRNIMNPTIRFINIAGGSVQYFKDVESSLVISGTTTNSAVLESIVPQGDLYNTIQIIYPIGAGADSSTLINPIRSIMYGVEEVFGDAYNAGYNAGYDEGVKNSFDSGYNAGYDDGVNSGIYESSDSFFYALVRMTREILESFVDLLNTKIVGNLTFGFFVIGVPAIPFIVDIVIKIIRKIITLGG